MKNVKILCAGVLSISLFMSLSVPCFAATNSTVTTPIVVATSDTELLQQMNALGFSQAEIDAILQLEEERLERLNSGIVLYGFPPNPQEGDWHYEAFDIHLSTINVTVAGITAALVKHGAAAVVAAAAAQSIMNELMEDSNCEAIEVTLSYRYGITNDGVPGWSYGPITWKLV